MRVALEEHFICPGFLEYLAKGMPRVSPASHTRLIEDLLKYAAGFTLRGFQGFRASGGFTASGLPASWDIGFQGFWGRPLSAKRFAPGPRWMAVKVEAIGERRGPGRGGCTA